jgi:hypothetical protein
LRDDVLTLENTSIILISFDKSGWGARIRTWERRNQNPPIFIVVQGLDASIVSNSTPNHQGISKVSNRKLARKSPKPTPVWSIYELASKAVWLGVVEAADARDAMEKAAKEFRVPSAKLMALRWGGAS